MSYRFHVVGLPHTQTSKTYNACAYTQKVLNFCRMMMSLGHEVYHYGAEGSDPLCTEHVDIISQAEQRNWWGKHDWKRKTFAITWDPKLEYWRKTNRRAAREIGIRLRPHDFVCLVGGGCQKQIADLLAGEPVMVVEPFIGYYGTFARYRVFESYTHQACVYARQSSDPDGRFYDAVVPNYFDLEDFPPGDHAGGYVLYIGRLTKRKGVDIAVQAARAAGMKLALAGQGVATLTDDLLVTEEGQRFALGEDVLYTGYADVERRAALMGSATAVLVPTMYMEPFGGVAVEAQMCGTPVITTDHAAFSETVKHGVTGWRCHTLEQFVWALQHAADFDHEYIRGRAIANWSIERVKRMYQEYFDMLSGLWGAGWPAARARDQMDWLRKD